jgi:hypothetical protein
MKSRGHLQFGVHTGCMVKTMINRIGDGRIDGKAERQRAKILETVGNDDTFCTTEIYKDFNFTITFRCSVENAVLQIIEHE